MSLTVEALAKQLDRLDALFPGIEWETKALARALLPLIERHIAAGRADAVPAANAWVADNDVEVTGEWMAGWDACRVEYPRHVSHSPQPMTTQGEAPPHPLRNLLYFTEHCISAAEEGVDYAASREWLDAMTTMGIMEKVGRGKWAPTDHAPAVARRLTEK